MTNDQPQLSPEKKAYLNELLANLDPEAVSKLSPVRQELIRLLTSNQRETV